MERGILNKCKSKESWNSNTHTIQIDFKIKTSTRDKEGNYIVMKGSIQEEDTTVNIYAPNIGVPQYMRQIWGWEKVPSGFRKMLQENMKNFLTKPNTDNHKMINSNTVIVVDFNNPLSSVTDQPGRKLIRKHRPSMTQ